MCVPEEPWVDVGSHQHHIFIFIEAGAHNTAQADFELKILLPLPPKNRDYSYDPPQSALNLNKQNNSSQILDKPIK